MPVPIIKGMVSNKPCLNLMPPSSHTIHNATSIGAKNWTMNIGFEKVVRAVNNRLSDDKKICRFDKLFSEFTGPLRLSVRHNKIPPDTIMP